MAEEAAPRQVLAERLHDLLVVAFAGSGPRDSTRSRSWWPPGAPASSRARRPRRRPGSARRWPAAAAAICCTGVRVGQRIDVRGVLRPDDELRLRAPGPRRTSSASRIVSRTWLSSTARRWALNSSPSRGTLPCTAATVTVGSSPAPAPDWRTCGCTQRRRQQHHGDSTGRAAPPPAARRRGRRRSPRHRADRSPASIAATLKPTSATAKRQQRHPAELRQRQQRPVVGLGKPTTPQGNPPNGTVDLSHSWADPDHGEPQRPARQRRTSDGEQSEQRREQRVTSGRQRQPRDQPRQIR